MSFQRHFHSRRATPSVLTSLRPRHSPLTRDILSVSGGEPVAMNHGGFSLSADRPGEGSPVRSRRWEIWSVRPVVQVFFLATEAVTVALMAVMLARPDYHLDELKFFGALLALAVLQAELSRSVERFRYTIANTPHVNMTSVWTFAGVLALPPGLAALLSVLVYLHLWLRVWRGLPRRPTYRVAYCAAAVVLSCLVAGAVARDTIPTGLGGSLLVVA